MALFAAAAPNQGAAIESASSFRRVPTIQTLTAAPNAISWTDEVVLPRQSLLSGSLLSGTVAFGSNALRSLVELGSTLRNNAGPAFTWLRAQSGVVSEACAGLMNRRRPLYVDEQSYLSQLQSPTRVTVPLVTAGLAAAVVVVLAIAL